MPQEITAAPGRVLLANISKKRSLPDRRFVSTKTMKPGMQSSTRFRLVFITFLAICPVTEKDTAILVEPSTQTVQALQSPYSSIGVTIFLNVQEPNRFCTILRETDFDAGDVAAASAQSENIEREAWAEAAKRARGRPGNAAIDDQENELECSVASTGWRREWKVGAHE